MNRSFRFLVIKNIILILMSTKTITRIIIGATIFVLVIIIFYVQSNLQQNVDREIVVEPEQVEATEPKKSKDSMTTDRLQEIEDSIAKLERNEVDQDLAIKDLSEKNEATVAASSTASDHKILTTTNAKGSNFTPLLKTILQIMLILTGFF